MARYIDKDNWEEEVVIPDTSTPILGGQPVWEGDRLVDGFANIPAAILADRTRHLKNKIDDIEISIDSDFSNFIKKDENLADLEDIQQAKYNLEINLVDNTRDMDKPVSTLQQEALDVKVNKEEGKGLSSNDFTDDEKNKLSNIEGGAQVNTVTSVAGRVGAVVLNKSDVDLNNVDNTTDISKPISSATQTALNGKANNTVNLIAGNGLTGGGTLTGNRTFTLGIPSVISGSTTNAVTSTSHTHALEVSALDVDGLEAYVDGRVTSGTSATANKLTTARQFSITGDATWTVTFDGTANVASSLTLANSGVVAGTYKSVTVDAKGRVTTGTNPTTLAGYGITDATPSTHIGTGGTSHAAVTTSVNGFMIAADKVKLNGIAANATANQTDAYLLNRANHTGSQPISSITNLQSSLDAKVDKQAGYGLSQENYTLAEKNKLASLESSKFKGEFVSLAALEAAFPTAEVGSNAFVDLGAGQDVVKYIWDSSDERWVLQQGESATLTPADVKSLYESNADTNAFTDAEKSKLSGIAAGATANVGTVTSVGIVPPTGISATSAITTSGNITLTFTSGYSIPTNAKQTQWDTAYSWGNHASAGYALSSSLSLVATSGSYNDLTNRPGNATTSSSGLMSSTDKSKLDGVAAGATANTGTVTSVQVAVPTGLSVSGGPITSSGTITVSFASGYALPTTAKQASWDTAVGWGNHALAGYATTAALTSGLSGKLDSGANAASATKLNTARNINGTSFDGTSNITTSSWGTSRTITIGSTGKSVDGSGNVSWSLSDIGAAATSHSHPASQISDSTAVGRGVLTAVDAAAARVAIGAGTSDLAIGTTASTAKAGNWQPTTASKAQALNGTANTFVSGAAYHNIIAWTSLGAISTGTLAVNLDTSLNFTVSVGGNITVGNPTNADPGKCGEIVITMTANGTVAFGTNWKFLNTSPNMGDNGEIWVISYKVLDSSTLLATASKVA